MPASTFPVTNEGAAPASDASMFVPPPKKDNSDDVYIHAFDHAGN